MAASKSGEKRCRKKIASLLSLMGFHDDDPETTIIIMRQKLGQIQQKEAAENKNKKLSANTKKITFKCGPTKPSSVIHLETLNQTDNFSTVVVPKKKRSNIQRVASSKFRTKTTSAHDHSKMIIDADDNHHSPHQHKLLKEMEIDHMMIIDDAGFESSIGGSKPELVIEKRLDVAKNHGRLLIPVLQVMNPATFLTSDEKWLLANKKNISVCVFDPQRRKYTLNLGQWNMTGNQNYVLKKQWNQVVSVNGFVEGMVLQVVSFRIDQQICFALVHVL